MSEQQPTATETAQPDPLASLPEGVEERSDALLKMLSTESIGAEPDMATIEAHFAEQDGDTAPEVPRKAEPPKDAGPPQQADDKLERLKKAAEVERQAHAEKSKLAEYRQRLEANERALSERERSFAERESQIAEREKHLTDPAFLLPLLRSKVPPNQLAEWMTEEMNPATAAEWAMKRAQAQQPKENSELKEMRAELDALKRERVAEAQRVQHEAARKESADKLMALITDETPHLSALSKGAPEELLRRADAIADRLVAKHGGATYNQVLSELEKELTTIAKFLAPQSQPAAEPVARADRARTLTAGNSAGRSSIANVSQAGSVEEKAAALKRLLGGA